jgi:hypothetical protein
VIARGASIVLDYIEARRRAETSFERVPIDQLVDQLSAPRRAPSRSRHAELRQVELGIRLSESILARIGRPSTCLFRALARYSVLARRGFDVRFVLGAPEAERAGHAWIELGGEPFLEPGQPRFTRVFVSR